MINFIVYILVSYLLGSIPFGLIIAKIHNIDIRLHGSGNIGATNVFRVLGKKWGLITFFLDAIKGFIPTYFFSIYCLNITSLFNNSLLFGLAAILGHTFSIFLKFRGGKGVATTAGVLLGVSPIAGIIGLIFWIIFFIIFRYVSLASIIASIAVAATVWIINPINLEINILLSSLSLLIIWLHRTNIYRLINGTENRASNKKEN